MEEDNKITGAKNGVQTMLFYFLSSVIGKVEDPKQYIASELGKMIDLSEEQIQYVQMCVTHENKMLESLSSSISLLKNMEKTGELDLDSVKIVRNILEIMSEDCKQVLEKYEVVTDGREE